MITLVKRTNEERRELFRNTADKMGLQDAIIEKDFWVCSPPEMLRKVVEFKMKFYPRAWARYEDVLTGGLKLIPPSSRLDALAEDYAAMKEMLFGKHPSFENILTGLQALEDEISGVLL